MAGGKTISGGQMLGIVLVCLVVGLGLGCLYLIHPLLLGAGVVFLALVWCLIAFRRKGKKVPVPAVAVLGIVFAVLLGLGLYRGLSDPTVMYRDVLADERVQAALAAGTWDAPSDGELTEGVYLVLRQKNKAGNYTVTHWSSGRGTRSALEKLQTVILVSDYQVIDSKEYVLTQFGKQVGQAVTGSQYRVRISYYDVSRQQVARTDVLDGAPLTSSGGGGMIPDSEIVRKVKESMTASAR